MVDTGSLTPVAEMADKFLVQAKSFTVNIIGRIMAHQLLVDDTGRAGFIRAFPEGFFLSACFLSFGSIP